MRVVVTRPKHSGLRTAQQLLALGHSPLLLPLTAAVHDVSAVEHALRTPHSALAVTSAEAIEVLAALGGRLQTHLQTAVFTVGKATADTARRHGFTHVQSANAGGQQLAELIAAEYRAHGTPAEPLLYLAGLPRAHTFEQQLTADHIRFNIAQCYAMTPVVQQEDQLRRTLLDERAEAILLYSFETTRVFFDLPMVAENPDAFAGTQFLCLSPHVAAAVPDRLRAQVAVAATPDEAALFALL
jgi:uroporphyrinogen-III synthase